MKARSLTIFALAAVFCGGARAQTLPGLDTTTFIVMGEGLGAGMANFGLSSTFQNFSFPAQAAARMNTALAQPLIQPPGIGDVVGYPGQEVRLQTYPQGAVREFYRPASSKVATPALLIQNLSVPGLTLANSISLRPVPPIAQRNMKQTVVNLILGFPQLLLDRVPLLSQFEYAKFLFPTVTLIELGYYEALDAAVNLDPTRLPNPNTFGATYGSIIAGLRGLRSQVIVTTIPNPLDTAYFSSPEKAASVTATEPFVITTGFHITSQDYLTRNALMTISGQFANGVIEPLPPGSVMTAATAAALTSGINALNVQILSAAKANGAEVYDLAGFLHKVKLAGASTGTSAITADYLGGFYSLDAVYPGPTGNALIANDFLTFLNTTYRKAFLPITVSAVASVDPLANLTRPTVRLHTAYAPGASQSGYPEK